MRAIAVSRNGGPEVLEPVEVDAPRPGPGEVLVDVTAAGVNFADIYAREGRPPYQRPTPFIAGQEGAGRVREVGAGVTSPAVGDVVAWTDVPGSYAEQVVVPADRAVPVPGGVDPRLAAAVLLQGLTAHYLATSTFPIRDHHVAVVHAAAGGVGLLLTRIVRHLGGVVVATTSGGAKADLAREAGAQHVTSYDQVRETVSQVTGGVGADVVYDGVGAATFDTSLQLLRRRGMLVLYGGASGPVPPVDPQRLSLAGSLYLTRPTLAHYIATREELIARASEVFSWVGDGWLQVRVGATYPLADAARAHADLASRRTTGKLLLLP